MVFDLPNNVTSIVEILPITNTITSGLFGVGVVIGIAFVSLIITSSFKIQQSLIASSFLTFIVAFFLYYLNIVSQYALFASIAYLVVSMIVGFISKEGGA